MEILFLCGVFASENQNEVIENAKQPVEFSANIFQEKMIQGLKGNGYNYSVISAPFIGSFPNASNIINFTGFKENQQQYEYVNFNNVWGIRNFSRAKALKKKLDSFIKLKDPYKVIIVYSPHTPFLDAAVYAKKMDSNIKICLVVPDLPQYMNLSDKVSWVYKIGKKYDIAKFNKLNDYVDSYVILTELMKEPLAINDRPYIVVEGLVTFDQLKTTQHNDKKVFNETNIVYTGKLDKAFGVIELVDSFLQLNENNCKLVLCGTGDAVPYIEEKRQNNSRIVYCGQVTPLVAYEKMLFADVLVNPRKGDKEYTKYSFPSKNIEYLLTGNEVVGYPLDGIPKIYNNYMHFVCDDNLAETIKKALKEKKNLNFKEYANNNLESTIVIKKIIDISIM